MMDQYYNFDNKDNYYAATASGVDMLGKYTLNSIFTKRGVPETTTLRSPHGKEGTIHWKSREIEIGGVKHLIEDLRRKDTGPGYVTSREFSPTFQVEHAQVPFCLPVGAW